MYSIPELRRSFEHIEKVVDERIHKKDSREKMVRDLRKEWRSIFMKDLDKKSAEAFIDDRTSHTMRFKGRRRTLRTRGGAAIAGAPLDYTTRQGVYLAPGQIPDKAGHLPLTGNKPSDFGSYLKYVSSGFSVGVPEPGQSYDPVAGQPAWPQVPAGMGSNTVHFAKQNGGSRRKIRRGGGLLDTSGALLSQAFSRPFGSSSPPGFGQNMQSMWYGTPVGPSPDQVQRQIDYQIGSVYPKAVTIS